MKKYWFIAFIDFKNNVLRCGNSFVETTDRVIPNIKEFSDLQGGKTTVTGFKEITKDEYEQAVIDFTDTENK